jgi:hypothetical protein
VALSPELTAVSMPAPGLSLPLPGTARHKKGYPASDRLMIQEMQQITIHGRAGTKIIRARFLKRRPMRRPCRDNNVGNLAVLKKV